MPHLKVAKIERGENNARKEIIIFDGEITEEHNKKISNFFHAMIKRKEELIKRIEERYNKQN